MRSTPHRKTTSVRFDPVDLATLEGERRRRAAAGEVFDLSALIREAVRRAFMPSSAKRAGMVS